MKKFHPCSKEFQDEAKRLGLTGNELINKYIKEDKLPNPTEINKKINEGIANRAGFKNHNEYEYARCHKDMEHKRKYLRDYRHDHGINEPMEENKYCSHHLGTHIAERYYGRSILPEMFGSIEKEMPYGNPYFDFLVKGGIKVDIKSCCLRQLKGWEGWEPHVRNNNVTDYFVMLAFDTRELLNLLHVWSIERNNIIRGNYFYDRASLKITNKYGKLLEFKRFDWINKLECLKTINVKNIIVNINKVTNEIIV